MGAEELQNKFTCDCEFYFYGTGVRMIYFWN